MSLDFQQKLKHYRISESEYQKICELLGREPRSVEWALFSALWSEHCSYKSSRAHLKKFAQTINPTVLNAAGENAGVVDLGFGERIAFKMESHNHPSFIEPYQGAATGVGGILRDIFTMGARPVAIADYLCFGETEAARMPALMDGVVRGISGYGNCVGVPTVTGQTNFDSSYNQNILVNAMAVGLFRPNDRIALSSAKGVGNLVVYVGAKTGKDGVHGAAMASESFDENSEAKKPNVQIGDPYFEKLLIESCLQVIQEGLVVSIQDMGAAGLTSSSFEMASKGQVGLDLHLDQVPLRDSSMTPEEILLSESQERMLLICEPSKLEKIKAHFSRWGLDASPIGTVQSERRVRLYWKTELLTELDPDLLVENAPIYQREFKAWSFPRKKEKIQKVKSKNLPNHLMEALESSDHASRKPIYRQYDQRVGAMTAQGSDHDLAILRLPDSGRGLAVAVGCRPSLMKVDAYLGALDAVIYPSLQMAVKGAKACAVTDCLNFGNPEKPEIMSEFVASVEAITEASKILHAPVISGNVSFYNETKGVNITSTPATGLIGIRQDVERIPSDLFENEGDSVFCLSFQAVQVGLSEREFSGQLNLEKVAGFQKVLMSLGSSGLLKASQMVGFGGLGLALAKMSLKGVGFESDLSWSEDDWSEDQLYRALLVTDRVQDFELLLERELQAAGIEEDCEFHELGLTGGSQLKLGSWVQISVEHLKSQHQNGLKNYFEGV
ncbi:MAG: phosphoribosylformylglycinamidine synthase subunit PurL [Pseudobdellovibrionaceae bacterium]